VPLLIVLILALAIVLVMVLMLPVSLVMRYRAGRTRRQARGWVAALNVGTLGFSVLLYLAAAGITSVWAPGALTYALAGLAAGGLLGWAGLVLARWDVTPRTLHFTPNAALVLLVTVVVAARLAYGVWRTWHAWEAGLDHTSAIVAAGLRGSLAAGGVVLSYYFIFWIGVLQRVRRHQRRVSTRPRGPASDERWTASA
jgi:hypothetical protein